MESLFCDSIYCIFLCCLLLYQRLHQPGLQNFVGMAFCICAILATVCSLIENSAYFPKSKEGWLFTHNFSWKGNNNNDLLNIRGGNCLKVAL